MDLFKNKLKKRVLVIKNIDIKSPESKKFRKLLKKTFSSPELYFSSYVDGQKLVIGKAKVDLTIIKTDNPQKKVLKRQSFSKQLTKGALKKRSASKQLSSNYSICSMEESFRNSVFVNNRRKFGLNPSNQNIKRIGKEDIQKKFEEFEKIEKENLLKTSSEKCLLDTADFKVKLKVEGLLNRQEKAMKSYNDRNKDLDKISSDISKKINRSPENLLMNTSYKFRMKKEAQDDYSKKYPPENQFEYNPYLWMKSLRYNEERENKFYIDIGDKEHKWNIAVVKAKNNNVDEHVRSPENLRKENKFYKSKFLEYKGIVERDKEDFFKVFKRTGSDQFKMTPDLDKYYPKTTKFKSLAINGRNLLNFEKDLFKSSGFTFYNEILDKDIKEECISDLVFK